jgi:LysR family cys regulon transcriptional activator
MNLQQLRYLVATARNGLNLSSAAQALHTSQPGISRQLRLLEEEIGAELLVRQGNRIAALTDAGRAAVDIATGVLQQLDNIRTVGANAAGDASGSLTIATTHVHARYILMPVLQRFRSSFPGVSLVMRQGTPDQIAHWVEDDQADIGLCTLPTEVHPALASLPCYRFHRCLVVPKGHDLLRSRRRLALEDLAKYAMINLDNAFAGGVSVRDTFAKHGISPTVVLTATDADVIKAYVAAGLGISTLPEVAYDERRDAQLRSIGARHLFAPSISFVWLSRHRYLRVFASEFIRLLSGVWTAQRVERAMRRAEPLELSLAVDRD